MQANLEAIRDTIKHSGEVRFHILYSRSNLTVTCRMWHPDGVVMGQATGGGYDRAGAALGLAIEKLFPEELKKLKPGSINGPGGYERQEGGLYGLAFTPKGPVLDGSCGLECMLKVLEALGFKTDDFNTGPASRMILGRKESAEVAELRKRLMAALAVREW